MILGPPLKTCWKPGELHQPQPFWHHRSGELPCTGMCPLHAVMLGSSGGALQGQILLETLLTLQARSMVRWGHLGV